MPLDPERTALNLISEIEKLLVKYDLPHELLAQPLWAVTLIQGIPAGHPAIGDLKACLTELLELRGWSKYVDAANARAPEHLAFLEVTDPPGVVRGRVPIVFTREGPFTIGRASSSGLQLSTGMVSRRHAQITLAGGTGGRFLIEDLGSQNGTYVNGDRVGGGTALSHCDVVRIGDCRLLFLKRAMDTDLAAYQRGWWDAKTLAYSREWLDRVLRQDALVETLKRPLVLISVEFILDRQDPDLGGFDQDRILEDVSRWMYWHLPTNARLARMEGMVFVGLLPDCSVQMAQRVEELLRSALTRWHYTIDGEEVGLTTRVAIGILPDPSAESSDEDLPMVPREIALEESQALDTLSQRRSHTGSVGWDPAAPPLPIVSRSASNSTERAVARVLFKYGLPMEWVDRQGFEHDLLRQVPTHHPAYAALADLTGSIRADRRRFWVIAPRENVLDAVHVAGLVDLLSREERFIPIQIEPGGEFRLGPSIRITKQDFRYFVEASDSSQRDFVGERLITRRRCALRCEDDLLIGPELFQFLDERADFMNFKRHSARVIPREIDLLSRAHTTHTLVHPRMFWGPWSQTKWPGTLLGLSYECSDPSLEVAAAHRLLRLVVSWIQGKLPKGAWVVRLEDRTFAIVLPWSNDKRTARYLRALDRDVDGARFRLGRAKVAITGRVAVAAHPWSPPENVKSEADTAAAVTRLLGGVRAVLEPPPGVPATR